MEKNASFEWKPVSSGNEKFMIVLSWLVVAFIVIVTGLYYGKAQRGAVTEAPSGDAAAVSSSADIAVGQGELVATPANERIITKMTLGKNEVYAVRFGDPRTGVARSEAEARAKELVAAGFGARAVVLDARDERYTVLAGGFETLAQAESELEKLRATGLPAALEVIPRELAKTFPGNAAAPAPAADPIRTLLAPRTGEAPPAPAATPTAEVKPPAPPAPAATPTAEVKPPAKPEPAAAPAPATPAAPPVTAAAPAAKPAEEIRPVALMHVTRIGGEKPAPAAATPAPEPGEDDLALEAPAAPPAAETPAGARAGWKIQLATFGSKGVAENYRKRLEKDGFDSVVVDRVDDKYVVRITGFATRDEANAFVSGEIRKYDPKLKPIVKK